MRHGIRRCILLFIPVVWAVTGLSAYAQSPPVTLLVSGEVVAVGVPSTVNVLIDCSMDACAAAHFSLQYDAAALRVEEITLGTFPASGGNTPHLIRSDVDNTAGTLTVSYVTVNEDHPPSAGIGILVQLTVVALQEGEFTLAFTEASVASLDGQTVLKPQTVTGTLIAVPAVASQTLTIRAEAISPDRFSVSVPIAGAIVSETIVGDALQVEIAPDASQAFAFEVDAPGHLGCTASGGDNREIILRAGDLNDDGRIDMTDVALVGTASGDDSTNTIDMNGDQRVNIYELIHIGRNYGMRSGEC